MSSSAPAPPIRTFSYHYRQKFGFGVGKIPVDMGQICPNREHGGCIYCRAASYTPSYLDKTNKILEQISLGKKHGLKGRFKKYFAYFQQETCTAVDDDRFIATLSLLLTDESCIGLILSTRPDYIRTSFLHQLSELVIQSGKECLIELGLQSVHERSLSFLNRNHSYADFSNAVKLIQGVGCFEVGVHLILGIPGESEIDMLESVRTVCSLKISALKLHHLQVISDTPLQKIYQQNRFHLFSLEEYLDLLLKVVVIIPEEVAIHRLWSTSHPDILIGPKWNVLASELSKSLLHKMELLGLRQGQLSE